MPPIFADLALGTRRMPAALYFAWSDTKARYRRSTLGPLWLVMTTAIGVAGLGFVWSALLKMDRAIFIPSLTAGLITWQFLSACLLESTTALTRNAPVIRNIQTPYSLFSLQTILKQLINFAHNLLVLIGVLLIFHPDFSIIQLLMIPGLLLVVGNLLWICMLLSFFSARFRDIDPLVSSVMPMLFFVSPVIYRPEHLSALEQFIWINPFSYFITLIRDPALGSIPEAFVYQVSLGMLFAGWVFTLWVMNHRYNRIAFWI